VADVAGEFLFWGATVGGAFAGLGLLLGIRWLRVLAATVLAVVVVVGLTMICPVHGWAVIMKMLWWGFAGALVLLFSWLMLRKPNKLKNPREE
jgi:hypothetical protein